jgi:hypothetical protein
MEDAVDPISAAIVEPAIDGANPARSVPPARA